MLAAHATPDPWRYRRRRRPHPGKRRGSPSCWPPVSSMASWRRAPRPALPRLVHERW